MPILIKSKYIASGLAIVLAMTGLLTACGDKKETTPAQGDAKETDKYASLPKEISISMFDRGRVPAAEGTYEKNRWTGWINDNSGIKVNWVPVPRNTAQQKLNVLIAADEAPDIIWEYDRNYIALLASQGAIQPIDSYIEKYSTSYKKYLSEHPELKPYVTIDGKMYAVSSKRGIDTIANQGMWIRKDWLDKLGLAMPRTDEELLNVAKAFVERDPDGNGKNDTVGFAFNSQFKSYPAAMFASRPDTWYVDNGKIQLGRLSDRYLDTLAMSKKMYDGGMVDKEYITDKNYQRERQLWVTGKAGIYLGSWHLDSEYRDLKQNVPDAQPVPLESVRTKYGKFGLLQEAPASMLIAFNKNMKNPKAAVEFLDWMLDKGWFTVKFGMEGTHYKKTNGNVQAIDGEKNKKELDYGYEYPIVNQWDPKPDDIVKMAASDPLSQEYAKLKALGLEMAMKSNFRRDIPYAPSFPELSQFLAEFTPKADEIDNKVIMGGPQLTPEWGAAELLKEWKRLNGESVWKQVQEWYDKNKDSLKQ
ncbi:extracellular solute-binding protein [Paenibacillus periandrae]|uniref:extracellular solute-binding protein n=1 Tax=Paenibacillus periandrae TaxID=1761741 RepID=UPI001F08C63B|nr:extracellular solute-binding protein [Paenibacillus periandrae]